MNNKLNLAALVLTLSVFSSSTWAVKKAGNGGGEAHNYVYAVAKKVLSDLAIRGWGRQLVVEHNLDMARLKRSADATNLRISNKPLFDNLGNYVDSLVEPNGSIVFYDEVILNHIDNGRDYNTSMLKELLRSAGYNNGNQAIEIAHEYRSIRRKIRDTKLTNHYGPVSKDDPYLSHDILSQEKRHSRLENSLFRTLNGDNQIGECSIDKVEDFGDYLKVSLVVPFPRILVYREYLKGRTHENQEINPEWAPLDTGVYIYIQKNSTLGFRSRPQASYLVTVFGNDLPYVEGFDVYDIYMGGNGEIKSLVSRTLMSEPEVRDDLLKVGRWADDRDYNRVKCD